MPTAVGDVSDFDGFMPRPLLNLDSLASDVGLLCYLLGINEPQQVATHPLMGSIFENMVVVEMLKERLNSGKNGDLYYMRTSHGVELSVVYAGRGASASGGIPVLSFEKMDC